MQQSRVLMVASVGVLAGLSHSAFADINGFKDNFSFNKADTASDSDIAPDGSWVHLTNGVGAESRSAFYKTPQNITQFTASFTYRSENGLGHPFGACFVLQNSANGPQTVAATGWQFGYGDQWGTFSHSTAVSLEYGGPPSGATFNGKYTDGLVGGGAKATGTLNLCSGNPIAVTITYNGSLLHSTFSDPITGGFFESAYVANIPLTVGNSTALVGFTAGSGGSNGLSDGSDQYISNFTFSSVPTPGAGAVAVLMSMTAACRRRR